MAKISFKVIGIMSGTSLDGLDVAYCEFEYSKNKWQYEMSFAETYDYTKEWKERLANIENDSAFNYALLDVQLGKWMGEKVKAFIQKYDLTPDFVSSHGHTVFHQPEIQLTTQIGSGASLSVACGYPVVNDFRSVDLALRGQGAPLVPIGDKVLFSDFDCCINLGGIANISLKEKGKMLAYDICPANMPLNFFTQKLLGKAYDADGAIAKTGKFDNTILEELNKAEFYQTFTPKSLGKEWVLDNTFPALEKIQKTENLLATSVEHTAFQIKKALDYHFGKNTQQKTSVLLTGGGALNTFLVERIKAHSPQYDIIIPDSKTIIFKEALIFAFLGVLRILKQNNCLSSVTGATVDNCGGAIYEPFGIKHSPNTDTKTEQDSYNPLEDGFDRLLGCGS